MGFIAPSLGQRQSTPPYTGLGLDFHLGLMGLELGPGDNVSVAVETNGKGFIGFLAELPGAFVRGRDEAEILSKVDWEVKTYFDWLGIPHFSLGRTRIIERHSCQLMVEDADGEILLTADRSSMNQEEFRRLAAITRYSGKTFVSLYDSSQLRDWVDSSRVRKTFYGETPKTIREVFNHVAGTQHYYLSRVGLDVKQGGSFLDIRELGLERIWNLFQDKGNSLAYRVDGESWTVKKVLRRFIWHDRIHGKAITRILAKQKRLGLIESYEDSFRFGLR